MDLDILTALMPTVGHKTYKWRKALSQVRHDRRVWAKKVSRLTGLRIVGSADGQWVRRINLEQVERLATQLGLDDAGKTALAAGDPVAGISLEDLTKVGLTVAAAVEKEYLTELTTGSVRAAVLKRVGTYNGNEWTAQRNFPRELGFFWGWVRRLRELPRGVRSEGHREPSLPGLTVDVVDLLKEDTGAIISVPVLDGHELVMAGGLAGVEPIFLRVAGYLGVLGHSDVSEKKFVEAEEFFRGFGLVLTTAGLRGSLRKDWSHAFLSGLPEGGKLAPDREALLIAGARRLFERAGLFIDPTCREGEGGLVRSTGLVGRAADLARAQLIVREIRRSGLVPEGYEASRLDAMWTKRKTGTVYRSVVRPRLSAEAREFWEADGTPQSRSIIMTETLGDVRLASLLDGATAGQLRRFMETQASAGLKAALDPAAPGALDAEALVSAETWKELLKAFFDARVWAAHELFYGSDPWMGLSPDYRRRLRLGLKHFFSWVEACAAGDGEIVNLEKPAFARVDPFLGKDAHVLLGADLPYNPYHRIGGMDHAMALVAEGGDLQEGDARKYWTGSRLDPKQLSVMRTVARLFCAGRNRAVRALIAALAPRASGGVVPDILRPVVPVDGPDPRAYLASLEVSRGVGLSRLFEIVSSDKAKTLELTLVLSKMDPKDFDLSFFDPRVAEMAVWVKVGGLRAQWEWARRQPQLIGLGGEFWFQEVVLLRLGVARAYSEM
jgi:hypothetical protein